MGTYPGDRASRRVDSRACAIVHYKIDADRWDYKVPTGHDVGTDCELELSEDGEWRGKKIEVQIKGTGHIDSFLKYGGAFLSFKLDKKTIRYGLGKTVPFFLFVVDVKAESVYFVELHDYFIGRPELFEKLESDTKSINILIPPDCMLIERDERLVEAAGRTYVGGPGRDLRLAQ